MKHRLTTILAVLVLAALLSPSSARAVSTFFTVGGYLKDSGGNPVNILGNVPLRVVYYDDATTTTATATFDTTTTDGIKNGVFSAHASIPDPLLGQPTLWYEMAIDTDSDGFDVADFFSERFQVNILDVGQPLLPTEQFDTCLGHSSSGYTFETNTVVLVPFMTPPGGVRFNRVVLDVFVNNFGLANLAIYDTSGDLVTETGATEIDPGDPANRFNPTLHAEGVLDGATIYYLAYVTTNPSIRFYQGLGMAWPYKSTHSGDPSWYKITTTNATLPGHIDQIELRTDNRPFDVGLWYISEDKSGSLIPKGKSK